MELILSHSNWLIIEEEKKTPNKHFPLSICWTNCFYSRLSSCSSLAVTGPEPCSSNSAFSREFKGGGGGGMKVNVQRKTGSVNAME